MNNRFREFNYEITTDPEFMDKQNAMTPELRDKLEPLYVEIMGEAGSKKTINKILNLIEKNPKNPQLKNYLSIAYRETGNLKKSQEVNQWIQSEHPDYLFGKLNEAANYYEKKKYKKIPEVLGELMEIQGLYPERDVFHLVEVTSFNKIAMLYFIAIGNLEAARSRLDIMKKVAPDHPDTEFASKMMMKANMEKNMEIWREDEKSKLSVMPASNILPGQITNPPLFANAIIYQLYKSDLYINPNLINEILSLPRESLIADLGLILKDILCRYEFFINEVDEDGWDEERMVFPIHAFFLLAELRAEDSLPKVLEVLRQDDDFLHFWFGEHLTESLWEPLYYLGNNQLDDFKKFIQKPGIETYAKTAISHAVSQIPYHQPVRNDEIIKWFEDVLDFYASSLPEDNVIDCDAIGLIIWHVLDLRYEVLLPQIKKLYDKKYVSEGIIGDYESVLKDIKTPQKDYTKNELLSIVGRYEKITSTWAGYTEEVEGEELRYDDYEDMPDMLPVHKEKKINRNDPCPCGSGKKYKKCCLDKSA